MSIRGKVLSSSLWSVTGTGATMISSFVVFALMTRLVRPIDFGLVAFAALFIDTARGLMSGGIPIALIQRKTWDEDAASTAFWMHIGSAFLFVAAVAALALPLAGTDSSISSGSSAPLAAVFVALSASIVIDAVRGIHEAKLRREFGYKQLAIRTVIASLVSGLAGVALAFAGFGVWALVGNRLISSVLQTAIVIAAVRWRPKLLFSKAECAGLFRFGRDMIGALLLAQLNVRIADFAIGFVLGPLALAYFRVGSRAITFLVQVGITPIQTTSLSAFSRLGEAPSIARAYLRMTRATALVSFPLFLGAAAVAPDFVAVCFGPQWAPSGPILTALGLVVAPATLLYFVQPALTALGRTKLVLASNLLTLVLNAVAALATVKFGVVAVAAGQTIRSFVTAPFALSILQKAIGLPMVQAMKSVAEPFIAAAAMAAAVLAARLYVFDSLSAPARLFLCVVLGSALYACLLLTVGRRQLGEVILELIPHLPPRARAAAEWVVSKIQPPTPAQSLR